MSANPVGELVITQNFGVQLQVDRADDFIYVQHLLLEHLAYDKDDGVSFSRNELRIRAQNGTFTYLLLGLDRSGRVWLAQRVRHHDKGGI